MQAYTDASVGIGGQSIHSYVLFNENNEILIKNCVLSNIRNIIKAEIVSVIAFLLECKKKKLNNVIVNTDSFATITLTKSHKSYGKLIERMNTLLLQINGRVRWISRKHNTIADQMCTEIKKELRQGNLIPNIRHFKLRENLVKKPELILKKSRKVNYNTTIESIEKDILSDELIRPMYQYYCSLVKKNNRASIDKIISWGETRRINNTKRGRKFLVEDFVVSNHTLDEINFHKIGEVFDIHKDETYELLK